MKIPIEKISSLWHDVVNDQHITREVFKDNETRANQLIARSMIAAAGLMLVLWLLNAVGVLSVSREYVLPIFLVGIVALVFPAAICLACRGEKGWIKYMLLITVTVVLAYLDSILTFNAPLLIALPVVFSCRYYSCSITLGTSLLTTVLFAASALCGAIFNFDNPDLNFANASLRVYVRDVMLLSFLPRWITFAVFSAFCHEIARYGRNMVLKQNDISQKTARVNTELEMAGQIQNQALPGVDSLPENRFRNFDLAAEMIPAKEVGGDFYDFVYADPSHLALIIADVADKGIAASLYMMMSKTLLDSRISMTLSPGQVLESVNGQLFANSPKGMFVTAWLGILDLRTGEMTAASAGHEYPVICRKDGDFELMKDRHGFVLGGWNSMKFPEYTVHLNEGDTLFVYTDGVPEANDASGHMFGTDRMLESLNRYKDRGMDGLIDGLRNDIGIFADGAPQFDDMTMLAFRLQQPKEEAGITVRPVIEELDNLQEYVCGAIGQRGVPDLQAKKIAIAVDEVFSNIVKYGQASQIWVVCEAEDDRIRITFHDDGMKYDPLEQKTPAVVNPRRVGGLGILITRKTMDDLEYRHEGGMNILTLTSMIKENQE